MCKGCVVFGDIYQRLVWTNIEFFTRFSFFYVLVCLKRVVLLFYTQLLHWFLHKFGVFFSSCFSVFPLFTQPFLLKLHFLINSFSNQYERRLR